jgi:hypothetical protein
LHRRAEIEKQHLRKEERRQEGAEETVNHHKRKDKKD